MNDYNLINKKKLTKSLQIITQKKTIISLKKK